MAVKTKDIAAQYGLDPEAFDRFLMSNKKFSVGGTFSNTISEADVSDAVTEFKKHLAEKKAKVQVENAARTANAAAAQTMSRKALSDEEVLKELHAIRETLTDIRKHTGFFYIVAIISIVVGIIPLFLVILSALKMM